MLDMGKMRNHISVLLVSPYSDNIVGGIINWTKYIVNYHQLSGSNVEMRLLNNANASQVMGSTSLIKRLFMGIINYLPTVRQFKKMVSQKPYDVVHICTSASLGLIRDLLIVNVARKKNIKTVAHMHFGKIPQILESNGWEAFLFKRLARTVDCIAVMDHPSLAALRDNGYANIRFVPNPLSGEVQRIIEECGTIKRESRRIVFVGHVLASKGLRELVSACKDIGHVELEILGKVSDQSFIENLYQIGGKGSKEWLSIQGNKSAEEVIMAMKRCAVFVLPSYSEGFPNVILESMACGCPIVATSVGAIPEMLDISGDHPCGICVAKQNVGSLRMAISELLDNPVKAESLGENARARVNEQYAISKVWDQLVGLWEETIK